MKFNCGPTRFERRERRKLAWALWHKHFIWWPTRMTGTEDCRWLEVVERQGRWECGYDGCWWEFEYRALTQSDAAGEQK